MPIGKKRKKSSESAKTSGVQQQQLKFQDLMKHRAYFRQWNRCAQCGSNLLVQPNFAYHVVSPLNNQEIKYDESFLKSLDNCVMLCEPCYLKANTGGSPTKAPITSSFNFPYSHGQEKDAHQQWMKRIASEKHRLFRELQAVVNQ